MLGEDDNIKDSSLGHGLIVKDIFFPIFYNKSNKLITALYMVTDIINKDEPLRNKLRTLGTEIISDMHSLPVQARSRIIEVVSFLEIASSLNLISEMNGNILKKEFIKLEQLIKERSQVESGWFEEFSEDSPLEGQAWDRDPSLEGGVDKLTPPPPNPPKGYSSRGELNSKGHTRIGVQKGGTLMQALSGVRLSNKTLEPHNDSLSNRNSFDILKKKRREDIIRTIKTSEGGSTITDIKNKSKELSIPAEALVSCSEKTLQRELIAMVKDGVLYKTGEKRWSRYSISKPLHSI
ncbi:MAG: hypothetical protein AAB786_01180 [Patescibacteria group bacterium]